MAKAAKRKLADKGYSPLTSPKTSKARKRRSHAAILSDADSDGLEEGVARLQSQQFLLETKRALKSKAVKQKDSHAEKFETTVEDKKQALVALLEKRAQDYLVQKTKAHEALTSVLTASLAHHISPSLSFVSDTGASPRTRGSPHPLQQKGISLLDLSKKLLRSYDTLSRDMARFEESLQVGQHWDGDYQKLQRLLHVGKQVTEDRLGVMLFDEYQDSRQGGEGQRDRKSWEELSGVGKGEIGGETWAVAARKVERGVRRLVRCLPDE